MKRPLKSTGSGSPLLSMSTMRLCAASRPVSSLPLSSSVSPGLKLATRSDEHTSELQSLMRISYAVFCLQKKNEEIYTTDEVNIITHNMNTITEDTKDPNDN